MLCECGCGKPAPIASRTISKRGWIKGQPLRFVSGHNRRGVAATHLRADLDTKYEVDDATGCWNWTGHVGLTGYGQQSVAGVCMNAHRAYWLFVGRSIPDGYQLDHLCGNRRCINPDHMEPVPPRENARRRSSTKLSADAVADIRSSNESAAVLAERYSVNPQTIRGVRRGERWVTP